MAEELAAQEGESSKSGDTPPARGQSAKANRSPSGKGGKRIDFTPALAKVIAGIGTARAVKGDAYEAAVILNRGEKLAKALNRLAQENEQIYRLFSAFYKVDTPYTEAGIALASIALPILLHRGIVPEPENPMIRDLLHTFDPDPADVLAMEAVAELGELGADLFSSNGTSASSVFDAATNGSKLPLPPGVKHTGHGWYSIEGHDKKVQGREAALAAWRELQAREAGGE